MPKSIAKSCPLCLSVNDPVDMLDVVMEHSTPPQTAPLFLCRRCVIAIVKRAIGSDLIDPAEVFPNAAAAVESPGAPDRAALAAEATSALVPEDQRHPDDSAVDRREPEVPAGGEGGDVPEPKG